MFRSKKVEREREAHVVTRGQGNLLVQLGLELDFESLDAIEEPGALVHLLLEVRFVFLQYLIHVFAQVVIRLNFLLLDLGSFQLNLSQYVVYLCL